MPLNECPICDAIVPTGEGYAVLKERVEHMKTHGLDFSYLLKKKRNPP